MKKTAIIILIATVIFLGLVYYNFSVAQKNIRETRPAPLAINLVSYPEELKEGNNGTFIWSLDTSPDQTTPRTTIFWGYSASPSALTKFDSPEAVSYAYHQPDYYTGIFKLPDTFELSINFEKTGTVYFRSYALVGKEHLWSEEKSIKVLSK